MDRVSAAFLALRRGRVRSPGGLGVAGMSDRAAEGWLEELAVYLPE